MTLRSQLNQLLQYMRDQQLAFPDHLTEPEREAGGKPDDWSAKDEIFHITVWANRHLDDLEIVLKGAPAPKHDYGDFVDENQAIFEDHKDRTWKEAQAMIRESYARAGAFIARCDEETLLSVPQGQERPVWRAIAGNFIIHPMIHLGSYYQRHGHGDLINALFNEQFAAQLIDLDDDDSWRGTTYYNLACFYALGGKKEEAIAALAGALPLVPELGEWSKQDSDLDSLRGDPAYQALYRDSVNSEQ